MAEQVIAEPIGKKGASRGFIQSGLRMLGTFGKMVRDPNYKFPGRIKLMTVLSIVYLVSPIDLIPEMFFLFFGFADDLALLLGTGALVVEEIKRYEKERGI